MQTEMEKKQRREESELMDLLIAKDWKAMFNIPDVQVVPPEGAPSQETQPL